MKCRLNFRHNSTFAMALRSPTQWSFHFSRTSGSYLITTNPQVSCSCYYKSLADCALSYCVFTAVVSTVIWPTKNAKINDTIVQPQAIAFFDNVLYITECSTNSVKKVYV